MKVDHMAQAAQSTASDHDLGEASENAPKRKVAKLEGSEFPLKIQGEI